MRSPRQRPGEGAGSGAKPREEVLWCLALAVAIGIALTHAHQRVHHVVRQRGSRACSPPLILIVLLYR